MVVPWVIAWMAGGLVGKLKGGLLGLVGAAVCSRTVSGVTVANGEKVFVVYAHHAAVVLGTAWLAARAFGVSEAVMVPAGAYLATLLVCERLWVRLWDSGMRLPWMEVPLRGISFTAGFDLRRRLPAVLWKLLVAGAVGFALIWTLDAVVGWYGVARYR